MKKVKNKILQSIGKTICLIVYRLSKNESQIASFLIYHLCHTILVISDKIERDVEQ